MIRLTLFLLLTQPPVPPLRYDDSAVKYAERIGKPLVVGVGCTPPEGDWVRCRDQDEQRWGGKCIAVVKGGTIVVKLPPTATAEEIRVALLPRTVVVPRERVLESSTFSWPAANFRSGASC